jgi:hypothetical protein
VKFQNNENLNPMESQLVEIIKLHPEYHHLIQTTDAEYFPEHGQVNPFLHINLHLALREQLSINQPIEVRLAYDSLLEKIKDPHEVEHTLIDCIAEMIFSAQKNHSSFDYENYKRCLNNKCI